MIKINKFFGLKLLAVLLFGFMVSAVYGQEPTSKPVADEMIGASGISWIPRVNYSQMVLTISRPDGTVFNTTFESGKTPYVDLSRILGSSYTDGSYTYELRVIPVNAQQIRRESELKVTSREGLKSHKALIQSGYFFIQGGGIARPEEPEGIEREPVEIGSNAADTSQEGLSGTADICYVDDLIVDGSLCVGFDCVCNYSFGFDTIVLRENNLRIFFDDTSTSGSFPRNDWRIVINDSANGGASYFGVEDSTAGRRVFTLEAGAPTHSLYVDDGGRVGFGTSTPVVDLHAVSGNTPTLRLDQDGSSGFSPQVWDVAGNETNFFIRDASNGSTLPFRIQPGTSSNALTVKSAGIGIGTWSPSYPVHLLTNSSTNATIVAERTSGAKNFMNATNSFAVFGAINDFSLRLVTNNSWRMQLNTDNSLSMRNGATCTTGGVWTDNSSRELKENIMELSTDEAMETLAGLNPVKYNYKVEKDEEYLGFIAEDVPELVAMKDRKHMTPMDVVAVLTKVVQEQQKSIKDQQKLAQEQQETISQLKKKIADLKKK
jgi:hypothetical protein